MLAQIIIKDEIILYETENPDEENLTMPFYGNAFIRFIAPGQKMRAYFTVDGQTKFLNEISGATYNFSCGLPLWPMDVQWTFSNVPAVRDVELLALQCQQVGPTPPPSGTCDWVELPVEFNADTQTEDKWNISVDVNYPNTPPDWRSSGYILFTETIPPGCSSANNNYCSSTTFHTPNIYMLLEEEGYADPLPPCNVGTLARLIAEYIPDHRQRFTNSHLFNENNLDACFNKNTQKWQFNFFSPSDFEIHPMLDYCEDNMAQYFVIEDMTGISEIFDCYLAEICFKKHKYQSGWSGWLYPGCYLIKEVVNLHEQLHFTDRMNNLIELKEKYNMNIELWEQKNSACNSFLNLTEAKHKALKFVKNQFTELMKEMKNRIDKNKDTAEKKVRSSGLINELVDDYLDALYNHCYN